MSAVHYKEDYNCTVNPLCGRTPAWSTGTLDVDKVTCRWCLRISANIRTTVENQAKRYLKRA